jgi:hypothetical protein
MLEWNTAEYARVAESEPLIVNESKSWERPPINLMLHVINPRKEYPHPHVFLIEPTIEFGLNHPDNVPRAHDKYLAAGWWK